MSKRVLTIEDHIELAAIFREFDAVVHKYIESSANRNGRVKAKVGDLILKADRTISQAKSNLEDLMFRDHPHDERTSISIYYGGARGR